MKKMSVNRFFSNPALPTVVLVCAMFITFSQKEAIASSRLESGITPGSVLSVMQRVADWQLAHPSKHPPTDWTQAAGDAGMMALAGISGNQKYLDAMLAMGEANHWRLGPRLYMADDHCIGQTYAELYLHYREDRMIAPLEDRFDSILAHPPHVKSLDMNQPDNKALELWSWCDALFMGPPTWMRLYAATGNERYLNFAVKNWWRTADFLYDKREHLFYRDSRFFEKREPNGKKVFWSRGNGWVMAGLVRMLQDLPANNPEVPRFDHVFQQMAQKMLVLQRPDSLWHSSLLDPKDYPEKETSGSGFITYALAWGVNQGLLDRRKFEPAVRKAWAALVNCVEPDGRLTHVQPIGGNPEKFDPNSTEVYGTGAFLLAGSEVYRMAVMQSTKPVKIEVTNPGDFRRVRETVELNLTKIAAQLHLNPEAGRFSVMDGVSSRILASQTYASAPGREPDRLLFQVDLAPRETRIYYVLEASALAASPKPIIKTFARYVPERDDDFAWESDRIAFRMYGPALMTDPKEPLTSSGIDVWVKRTRSLIVNQLYASKLFHNDTGTAMDDYRVGTSRGDGGLGIWNGKRLFVSKNYTHWQLITTGPIRSVFELKYAPWSVGDGRTVSEIKRISIDAGSWLSEDESIFESNEKTPLTIGVGLAERACGPHGQEMISRNKAEGWMTYWQPEDKPKGHIGVAILLPKGSVEEFTSDDPNLPDSLIHAVVPNPIVEGAPPIRSLLAITKVRVGEPFTYYFGACWNLSGDFKNDTQWNNYIRRFVECRNEPLRVKIVSN